MIISVRMNENLGHFVFPKAVLISKGIVSREGKSGKEVFGFILLGTIPLASKQLKPRLGKVIILFLSLKKRP